MQKNRVETFSVTLPLWTKDRSAADQTDKQEVMELVCFCRHVCQLSASVWRAVHCQWKHADFSANWTFFSPRLSRCSRAGTSETLKRSRTPGPSVPPCCRSRQRRYRSATLAQHGAQTAFLLRSPPWWRTQRGVAWAARRGGLGLILNIQFVSTGRLTALQFSSSGIYLFKETDVFVAVPVICAPLFVLLFSSVQ